LILVLDRFIDGSTGKGAYGSKLEDNDFTGHSVSVWCFAFLIPCAHHLADVLHTAPGHIFKKVEILSFFGMLKDSAVSSHQHHVSHLPFTCVKKNTVFGPSVTITVLFPLFTSEQENEGLISRGTNSALGLSAVLALEATPNISLAYNEHLNLLPLLVFA
jgi:hypothetical protein